MKKQKFCKQNLTKEQKQPPVVIPQQQLFCACGQESLEVLLKMFRS